MKLNRTKQGLGKMEYCMLFQVACYRSSLPVSKTDAKCKRTAGKQEYQYLIMPAGSTKGSLATNLAKFVEVENWEMRTEKGNVQTFHPQNLDTKIVKLSGLLGFRYENGEIVNSAIRQAYLDSLGEEEREYMEKVFKAFKSPYFHSFDYDTLRDLYDTSQGTYQGLHTPWVSYNYLDTILSVLVALFNYTVIVAYPNAVPEYLRAIGPMGSYSSNLDEFRVWNIIAGVYFPTTKKPKECSVEDYYRAKRAFLEDLYSLMQDAKDLTKKLYNTNFAVLAATSHRLNTDARGRLEKKYGQSLTPSNKSTIIEKMIQVWISYISLNSNNGLNTGLNSNNVISIESCIMNVLNRFLSGKFNAILTENAITREKFINTDKGTLYNESALKLDSRGADDDITPEDNAFITESMILLRQLDLQIFCDTYTRNPGVSKTENSKCKFSILEWKCMQDLTPYLKDSQQISVNFRQGKNSNLEKSTKFTEKPWEFSPISTQAALTNQRVVVAQKYQKHIEYYKTFLSTAYECYLAIKRGETQSWDQLLANCVISPESHLKNSFLVLGEDFKRATDLSDCIISEGQNCEYKVYNSYGQYLYSFSPEEANFIKEFNESGVKFKYFPTKQGYVKITNLFDAFERLDKLKAILAKRKVALVDLCILYFMNYNSCFDYKGLIRAGIYTWSSAMEEKLADRHPVVSAPSISRLESKLVSDAISHQYRNEDTSKREEVSMLPATRVIDTDVIYNIKAITRATVARILELAFPVTFSKGVIHKSNFIMSPLYEFLSNITTYRAKQIFGLIVMLCRDCCIYSLPKDLESQDRRLISLFRNINIVNNNCDEAINNVGVRKLLIKQLKTKSLYIDDIDVAFNNLWSEELITTEYINGFNSKGRTVKSEANENWAVNPLARRYSLKYALKKNKLNQSALDTIDRRGLTCEPETAFIFSNLGEMLFSEGRDNQTLNYCYLRDELVNNNGKLRESRSLTIPDLFKKVAKVFKNVVYDGIAFTFKGKTLKCGLFIEPKGVRPIMQMIPEKDEDGEENPLRAQLNDELASIKSKGYSIMPQYRATYLSVITLPEAISSYSYRGYNKEGNYVEIVRELPLHSIVLAYYWAREFNLDIKCKGNNRLLSCLNQCFDYETTTKSVVSRGQLKNLDGLDAEVLTNYVFEHCRFEKFLMWCRYLSIYGRELTATVGDSSEEISLDFLALEKADFRNYFLVPKCLCKNVETNVFYYCFYPLFMLINSYSALKDVPNPSISQEQFPTGMKFKDKVKSLNDKYSKGEFKDEDVRSKVFQIIRPNSTITPEILKQLKQYYDVCGTIARKSDLKRGDSTKAKIVINSLDLFNLVIEIPHLLGLLEHKVEDSKGEIKASPVPSFDDTSKTDEFTEVFDMDSSVSRLSSYNTEDNSKYVEVKPQEKVQIDHPLSKSLFFAGVDSTVTDYRFSEKFYEFFSDCYGELLKLQMLGKFSVIADNYRTVTSHNRTLNSKGSTSVVSSDLCNCLLSSQLYSSATVYGPSSSATYRIAGQETLALLKRVKDRKDRNQNITQEDMDTLEEIFFFYHSENFYFNINKDKYVQRELEVLFDSLNYREVIKTLGEELTEYKSNVIPVNFTEPLDKVMDNYRTFVVHYLNLTSVKNALKAFKRSTELASLLSICELTPVTHTEIDESTGFLVKNGSFIGDADDMRNYSLIGARYVDDETGGSITFQKGHYFLHESGAMVAVNECYVTNDNISKEIESLSGTIQKIENYIRVLNEIQEVPNNKKEFFEHYNRIIFKTNISNLSDNEDDGDETSKGSEQLNNEYPDINLDFMDYRECIENLEHLRDSKLDELSSLQSDTDSLQGNHVETVGYKNPSTIICALVTKLEDIEQILRNYIP